MKKLRISLLTFFISAFLIAETSYPAAFQFYELGTPIIGTAAVGQAAIANDASTSYFNPAGMVALQASQFLLGSQLIIPYTKFSKESDTTISGGSGGEAATLIPGMAVYYVFSYSPKLKFGVSLTSPYGGLLNYNDGWAGRYLVQDTEFLTLNLNPSVAYKINDWAAIGAGVAVEYANLYQTVALPLPIVDPTLGAIDGQADVRASNTNAGFNVGFLLTPGKNTKIGLAYRSQIVHNFKGTTTFLRIPNVPSTSTKMIMPQNIILSLDQSISKKFNLLGELGWSNWSTMDSAVVIVDNLSATTVLDWKDTYRVGLGGQYKLTPNFLVQTGVSYDSSPTTASLRTPDLPMDRQIRAGVGLMYSVMQIAQIDLSYEYINFGNAEINNISSSGQRLDGSYWKNWANVLQASVSIVL